MGSCQLRPAKGEGQRESFLPPERGRVFYHRRSLESWAHGDFKKADQLSVLVFFFNSLQTIAPLLATPRADQSHCPSLIVLLPELNPSSTGQGPSWGVGGEEEEDLFPPL